MKGRLRARDAGLQPERTAMSWHRTVFSSLVLALVITRTGISRGDAILASLGALSTFIALMLCILSFHRQKHIILDICLTSRSAVLAKGLLCTTLSISALAVACHRLIT